MIFFSSDWNSTMFCSCLRCQVIHVKKLLHRWWGFDRVGFPIGYSIVFSIYVVCLWEKGGKKKGLLGTKIFWKFMFHKKSPNYFQDFQDFCEVFWGVCFLGLLLENEAIFPKVSSRLFISDLKFWHSSTFMPPKKNMYSLIYWHNMLCT